MSRARLETNCISPGHWMVEGYEVERCRKDGKVWWQVSERRAIQVYEGEPYAVVETFHGKRRTLAEACDLIWDLTERGGK